jgi:hypothetical protein
MILNINEFKTILKKATINFSLDTLQLNINDDKISTKMTNSINNPIVILDIPNTCFPDIKNKKSISLNFSDPNQSVMPYINLISGDTADVDIETEKMVLRFDDGKQKCNIHFCSPEVVKIFPRDMARSDIEYFVEFNLTDDFMQKYNNLKKIGPKFGKVYFVIEESKLYMETTDKTNRFANNFRFEITDNILSSDLSLCFDYRNISNLFLIVDNHEDFMVRLTYSHERDLGMLYLSKGTEESYFLMSRVDIGN